MSLSITMMCCFADATNENDKEIVVGENKDVAVKAEAVKNDTGKTVGFRIELVNSSKNNRLVLMVSDNCAHQITVAILNKRGINISPRQELLTASESNRLKYHIISTQDNTVWFIPVPNKIRKNTLGGNEDNLQPIPPGEYMAQIMVSCGYFTTSNNKDFKDSDRKILNLKLPSISIQVDSSIYNANIEKIYSDSKQRKKR